MATTSSSPTRSSPRRASATTCAAAMGRCLSRLRNRASCPPSRGRRSGCPATGRDRGVRARSGRAPRCAVENHFSTRSSRASTGAAGVLDPERFEQEWHQPVPRVSGRGAAASASRRGYSRRCAGTRSRDRRSAETAPPAPNPSRRAHARPTRRVLRRRPEQRHGNPQRPIAKARFIPPRQSRTEGIADEFDVALNRYAPFFFGGVPATPPPGGVSSRSRTVNAIWPTSSTRSARRRS